VMSSSSSSFSIRPTQRREMAAAVRLNFPFMFFSLLFSLHSRRRFY
jgi:hypothetical protein